MHHSEYTTPPDRDNTSEAQSAPEFTRAQLAEDLPHKATGTFDDPRGGGRAGFWAALHPDTGCQWANRCLECWLPACKHDERPPIGAWARRRLQLFETENGSILELRRRMPLRDICLLFKVSKRTVQRWTRIAEGLE